MISKLVRMAFLVGCLLPAIVKAADPVVSNVRASQRTGLKLVDVWYDVAYAGTNQLTATVAVSTNNGASYDLPATSFSGNGYGVVTPGNSRQIVWNAGADWNGQFSSLVRFRVTATDAPAGLGFIPAGNFAMGDTFNEGSTEEQPVHTVYVRAFFMDKYLVSKAQWDDVASWAASHGYDITASGGSGKAANHPVQTVTWYECVKWCNARSEKEGLTPVYSTDALQTVVYRTGSLNISNTCVKWTANGYRLPTEAEWEKAARGGLSGKRFPWGDTITHSQANYNSVPSYAYDISPTRGYNPGYTNAPAPYTSPVGSFAANGYGLYDMAGNVWEWCWDRWAYGWYATAEATQADCKGATSGVYRLLRGGGWNYYAINCRSANRYSDYLGIGDTARGFRCVRR